MIEDVDDEVARFFRSLGYRVTWDCRGRKSWYEISDKGGLFLQIDKGVPLAHLLEDWPFLAKDKEGTSSSDYTVNGSLKDVRAVLKRIEEMSKDSGGVL